MVPVRDLTLKAGLYDTTMGLVLFHVAGATLVFIAATRLLLGTSRAHRLAP